MSIGKHFLCSRSMSRCFELEQTRLVQELLPVQMQWLHASYSQISVAGLSFVRSNPHPLALGSRGGGDFRGKMKSAGMNEMYDPDNI